MNARSAEFLNQEDIFSYEESQESLPSAGASAATTTSATTLLAPLAAASSSSSSHLHHGIRSDRRRYSSVGTRKPSDLTAWLTLALCSGFRSFFQLCPWIVALAIIRVENLTAVSLVQVYIYAFMEVAWRGISSSLNALISQSHGMSSITAMRGWLLMSVVFMLFCNFILMILCMASTDTFRAFGVDNAVSRKAGTYAYAIIPALFFEGTNVCLSTYLISLQEIRLPTLVSFVAAISNIFLSYWFVFDLKYEGSLSNVTATAFSWDLSSFIYLALIFASFYFTLGRELYVGFQSGPVQQFLNDNRKMQIKAFINSLSVRLLNKKSTNYGYSHIIQGSADTDNNMNNINNDNNNDNVDTSLNLVYDEDEDEEDYYDDDDNGGNFVGDDFGIEDQEEEDLYKNSANRYTSTGLLKNGTFANLSSGNSSSSSNNNNVSNSNSNINCYERGSESFTDSYTSLSLLPKQRVYASVDRSRRHRKQSRNDRRSSGSRIISGDSTRRRRKSSGEGSVIETGAISDVWEWSKQGNRMRIYLRQVIPNFFSVAFENFTYFVMTICAFSLGDNAMIAQNISILLYEVLFTITYGMCEATSIRIGFHVGRKDIISAKKVIGISLISSIISSCIIATVGIIWSRDIGKFFSDDQDVVRLFVGIAPIVWLSYVLFTIGSQLLAVLKGQGRAKEQARALFLGCWCVTLPLFFISTYGGKRPNGLIGLWVSLLIGFLVTTLLALFMVYNSDWEAIELDAKQRLLGITFD